MIHFLANMYIILKSTAEKTSELGALCLANTICLKMYTVQVLSAKLIADLTRNARKITSNPYHKEPKSFSPSTFHSQLIKSTNS